ncbi:DUF5958 family protein [Streptomyces decoyicus]|uniref:DUF5958 family protein n=1 Tax=Streptomyces decoyicus TaxID=249567 RepID=UPI0036590D96
MTGLPTTVRGSGGWSAGSVRPRYAGPAGAAGSEGRQAGCSGGSSRKARVRGYVSVRYRGSAEVSRKAVCMDPRRYWFSALPADEHVKAFRVLVSVFSVADTRRRQAYCKGTCGHAWHSSLPRLRCLNDDGTTIQARHAGKLPADHLIVY